MHAQRLGAQLGEKEQCLQTWGALNKGSAAVVHEWQRWVLQM